MTHEFNQNTKILIVGLGLIGGSYAEALTEAGFEVGAIDPNESSIRYAIDSELIRHGRCDVSPDYVGQFGLIVFALYPHVLIEWLEKYRDYIAPNTLLTDVTGVKSSIVYKVQSMLDGERGIEFIGAHPMAGRELSGVENARRDIFYGANYIVTPTEKNTAEAIAICRQLGEIMGFGMITELSPERHDEMIAFLSQLTHCIAVTLMVCRDSESLAPYTGDSFRDLTRIARINDEMWSELFLANREALLSQMELFADSFEELRGKIAAGDREGIREIMRLSAKKRAFFDKPRNNR